MVLWTALMPPNPELTPGLITGDLCGVLYLAACVGVFYLLFAALLVRRVKTAQAAHSSSCTRARSVTVLKPLHGAEPDLRARLAKLYAQDYPGEVQIVFGCQDRQDPAIGVVNALTPCEETNSQLVIDGRTYGANRKISNLINMFAQSRGELLVISDSDIEVGSSYLSEVLAPLEDERTGAVTCLYHGVAAESLASSFSALTINSHFLPSVVLAVSMNLATPCFGSTIAMRREALESIGGFAAFADKLADDYAIGQAIREAGLRVVIPPFTLGHVCNEQTMMEFARRQLRLNRTIRSIDPLGYAGAALCNPLPFAILGLAHGGGEAIALVCAVLAARVTLTRTTERTFGLPRQPIWLLPMTDLLLFTLYVWSYFGASITWRGRRYEIVSDGTLSHDRSTPSA